MTGSARRVTGGFHLVFRPEVPVAALWSRAVVCVVVGGFVCSAGDRRAIAQEALDAGAYVAIVLASHPAAVQGKELAAASAAERLAVRLWPDPVVSLSAGHGRAADALGGGGAETAVSVSQTIPWPAAFRAGVRAGDAAALAYEANADALRWELAAAARQAFARLVAARDVAAIARAAEEDARSLRDLVTRRADLGETREADRIKATVEWLRQQRALASAEREAASAEAVLRMLAVQPLPRPLAVIAPPVPSAVPAPRPDLAAGELIAANPRVRAAHAEAERQRALRDEAAAGRVPALDLGVFRNGEIDKASAGVSVGFRVPLWNANRGEIARAAAAAALAGAEEARLRLDLAADLETRLKDVQVAAGQVVLLQADILPSARRSVDLARFSYEEGETSLLDLLDAQRTLRDAQRELADARLALALALADAQRIAGPEFTPWK